MCIYWPHCSITKICKSFHTWLDVALGLFIVFLVTSFPGLVSVFSIPRLLTTLIFVAGRRNYISRQHCHTFIDHGAMLMLHYHAAKQCKSLLLLLSFSREASLLTWPGPHLETRILANHVQYQFDAMQNFKVSSVSLIHCQATYILLGFGLFWNK